MIPKVENEGRTYLNWPEEALVNAGVPEKVIAWAKLPRSVKQAAFVTAMSETPFPEENSPYNAWDHGAAPVLAAAPKSVQRDWQYITVIPLNHPTVQAMFAQVIPDEAQRKDLQLAIFQRAAEIDRQEI